MRVNFSFFHTVSSGLFIHSLTEEVNEIKKVPKTPSRLEFIVLSYDEMQNKPKTKRSKTAPSFPFHGIRVSDYARLGVPVFRQKSMDMAG